MTQTEHEIGDTFLDVARHPVAEFDAVHVCTADVTERRRADRRLSPLATNIALTGLPNRRWVDADLSSLPPTAVETRYLGPPTSNCHIARA